MKAPEPMYASIGSAMPTGRDWVFEQKYDGMRVVVVTNMRGAALVTRNGHDKRAQFPEIADAMRELSAHAGRPLVLDGEIVALVRGKPGAFQALQARLHRSSGVTAMVKRSPAAIVLFDFLRDGRTDLTRLPLADRRQRLEALLAGVRDKRIRISDSSSSGRRMVARAQRAGWEGVIAKRLDATYRPGVRSRDWLKLKLQHRAEFVVGGYTEPRKSREHIGALLLGYFDATGALRYVGHTGGGFDRESLRDMSRRLRAIERKTSPFAEQPRTNEPAHWVAPKVVVEVKFAEWTTDGKLRQPIFLGARDDKQARDVHREKESIQEWAQEIGSRGER
jgi:bifunctional non-homologous end joining protein LigD